jgi:hypothetical protein
LLRLSLPMLLFFTSLGNGSCAGQAVLQHRDGDRDALGRVWRIRATLGNPFDPTRYLVSSDRHLALVTFDVCFVTRARLLLAILDENRPLTSSATIADSLYEEASPCRSL